MKSISSNASSSVFPIFSTTRHYNINHQIDNLLTIVLSTTTINLSHHAASTAMTSTTPNSIPKAIIITVTLLLFTYVPTNHDLF